jgi:hypothetical protein
VRLPPPHSPKLGWAVRDVSVILSRRQGILKQLGDTSDILFEKHSMPKN